MPGDTISALDHMFKRVYTSGKILSLTQENNTFIDRCSKDTSFGGLMRVIPMIYGGGQGLGTTIAGAQANQTNTVGTKATYDVGEYFSVLHLNDKTIKAARKDMMSFGRHKEIEVNELLRQHGNDLSVQAWGNGGGSLGQRGSVASSTLTMGTLSDIKKIEKGMVITASANDGSASGHTPRSGSIPVTEVDYSAGTFDFTGSITSFADDDYLFRQYAFAGDVSQAQLWQGMQAHCPSSAPTTTLHGVDRTLSSRLHGIILPTAQEGGTYEELCEEFSTFADERYQASPKDYYMAPRHWMKASRQLQHKGVRAIELKNTTGSFGYKALEFVTPYGDARMVRDRHCPESRCYAIDHGHVKVLSMLDMVHPMNDDGLSMLRASASNDYELRFITYGEICVDKPSAHGSFALPSL
jgi:hypothetical protein